MFRPVALVIYALKLVGAGLFFFTPFALIGIGFFFGPDLFVFYQIFSPRARILCDVRSRFRPVGKQIWLTIDDGPDPEDTPRILELLEQHRARATFFVIGRRAQQHPELLAEIVRRGHELGCHTQTHPAGTFWSAGPRRVRREIDENLAFLRAAGAAPRWFRAPAGIKNLFLDRALRERRLACIGWSIRSHDCFARNPEWIAARVMRQVRPGAIVLMHEGPSVSPAVRVNAIALVLQSLSTAGFSCELPRPEQLV